MNENQLSSIITPVNILLEHQREMKMIKGESFNLFSLLKMERRENRTHSMFLSSLLNPKGEHLKGTLFLEFFLNEIGQKDFINSKSVSVWVEFPCGPIDYIAKTGGRIDIFMKDNCGNSISIENKIDADDQPHQIERYCNYNKGKNKVFYLTLFGDEATKKSAGELMPGHDYHLISYKETIIKWLFLCHKEASDQAILRENIRQYILLIQKITNSMEKKYDDQLIKLILSNYEAATYIATNLNDALSSLFEDFRAKVIERLKIKLKVFGYTANQDTQTTVKHAQIWILPNSEDKPRVYFGIEPFGVNANYPMFFGIFSYSDKSIDERNDVVKNNMYWSNTIDLAPINNVELHFGKHEFIQKLVNDSDFANTAVEHIAEQFMIYFEQQKPILDDFLRTK